jgi:hypothetical protein
MIAEMIVDNFEIVDPRSQQKLIFIVNYGSTLTKKVNTAT